MKIYSAVAVIALVCLLVGYSEAGPAVTKEEMDEAFKALAQKCKEDTGASDDDVQAVINHEISATPNGKCFRACVMQKFDAMSSDNMLNKDVMMKIADFMVQGDPEKLKVADEVIESCKAVTDGDKCEAAYKIMKCIKEAAKAKGATVEV